MLSLAELLPTAADRDAGGVAIRDGGASLTWSEAADRAGRLGAALGDAGVGPGDRVGVHLRKSAEAFLAMHAVVQRGAVAVPLDPTAPTSYLSAVVDQTEARVIVTHEPCRASATDLVAASAIDAIVGLDPSTPPVEGCRFVGPAEIDELDPTAPHRPDPGDLAYIITTSGSTGVPKGIAHTHASALAYVDFKLDAYDLRPDDRVSDIAPNHFDISTFALWVSPAVGAANVVVSEPHQILPASLSQLAADEAISFWYSVPYLLTQLLDRGQLDQRDLSALRWVLFGGEPFPPKVLARLMGRLPRARFSNVYGPAEVNACTVHHLDRPPVGDDPIPIGRPAGSSQVRLVPPEEPTTTPTDGSVTRSPTVSVGEARNFGGGQGGGQGGGDGGGEGEEPAGEIWVAAPTMMAGYWRRPDLDRRAIVTGPDGQRWYRTGDLAHRLDSGDLVFTGRVDHQVKVRGHRIELEAIETILEDAPGVAAAVAAVARRDDGGDVVVAGLAPAQGAEIDAEAIRLHATGGLPAYAVPGAFALLAELFDALPTTGSGKLDRRAIRASLAARHTEGTGRGVGTVPSTRAPSGGGR